MRPVGLAASLLALAVGGCGASVRGGLSAHDQTELNLIEGRLSTLTQLRGEMNTDPVAGTRPRRHADYVRTQQPLIEQFGRTTRHLRREVSSLDDRHATELYIPLVRAVYREANDLKLFLSSVIARDQKLATRVYSQLVKDEQRTAAVASAQFPKVRALRSYSSA